MFSATGSADVSDGSRQVRIRQVVNDCLQRRAAGVLVSDQSLIDAHPDLMPELAEQLHNLQLIWKPSA